MFDTNEMFRAAAAGNMTADETGTGIPDGPYPFKGVDVLAVIPAKSASDSVVITIEESDSLGSGYTTIGTITVAADGNPGTYRTRVYSVKKYHRYSADVTGSGVNFGAVQIGLATGGQDRNENPQPA